MSAQDRKSPASAPRERSRLASSWVTLPKPLRWMLMGIGGSLGLLIAGVLSGVMLLAVALSVAYPNLPEISGLTDYRPKLPLRVYSADGALLGEFGEERRQFTPIAQIPKLMQEAVLAVEDARFYEHSGVDYIGIVRAGLANVGEARSQGASTITMQVARNFYLPTEKTFIRKVYEILLALKIESQLKKEQILEIYMNQIYLGQRAYGFTAASEIYFGKPLTELTVAEAAMLAGLPKAPSAYNPVVNPKRARARQLHIIDRMYETGYITDEQSDEAREQALKYRTSAPAVTHSDYVTEAVRQLIYSQYGEAAYSRGLNVHTSIRVADQESAFRALRRGITDYEQRQFYRGPEASIDLAGDAQAVDVQIAEVLDDHPDNGELRAAVVLEAGPQQVVAVLQNGEQIKVTGAGLKPVASGLSPKANPKVQIRRGSVVRMIQDSKGNWALTQLPDVEGAFIAMDPRTGAIQAMVGGFDHGKTKFNRVTQAWRQPGSSFKPFIYSAALEKGYGPATVINDAPLFFTAEATGSQPWEPKNYDGTFEGPMSMRRALAKSKNMVSIRLLEAIGTGYAQGWITRFGFDPDKHLPYLPMALGTGSVTPLQMARGYAVFANGGYRVDPMLITRVTDTKGRVLSERIPAPPAEAFRAIDARNAFMVSSLLQEVTRSGTAARAQSVLKRPDLYGKTGTTNDSLDAWFAGYAPGVVAVVWIGHDQPRKLGSRETGGGLSLPVWIDYMSTALKGVPVAEMPVPEGVVNIGGEWYYEEYTPGLGIPSLGMEEAASAPAPTEDERRGILDLFKN